MLKNAESPVKCGISRLLGDCAVYAGYGDYELRKAGQLCYFSVRVRIGLGKCFLRQLWYSQSLLFRGPGYEAGNDKDCSDQPHCHEVNPNNPGQLEEIINQALVLIGVDSIRPSAVNNCAYLLKRISQNSAEF